MAQPKWLEDPSTRARSGKQENKLAKKFKGHTTINSGALFQKNDVWSEVFSIEAKTTKYMRYSITEKMMEEITKHASKQKKIGILIVDFEDGKKGSYVTLNINDFMYLFEELNDSA